MKVFFAAFGISFSIIGAVIGAGFITGAEIVRFFSTEYMLPTASLLFLLFFAMLYFILDQGRLHQNAREANSCVLGGFSRFFEVAMITVAFSSACGMTAALDAVFASFFGINERLPTLSLVCLPLSLLIVKRGVSGVAVFNSLLVPIMIAAIIFACSGAFFVGEERSVPSKVYPTLLYVAMNCFTSAPVISDLGRGRDRKTLLLASAVASAVISVCVYMIMRKISSGYGTDKNLPLLSALKSDKIFYVLFSVITLFGVVTTLVASHYTLVTKIDKSRLNRTLNPLLLLTILLFSRIGFGRIVDYVYPAVALVGMGYCALVARAEAAELFPVRKREFFNKGDKPVHPRGKQAKDQRCGEN